MDTDQPARISRRAAMRVWITRTTPLLLLAAIGRPAAAALNQASSPSPAAAPGARAGSSQVAAPACVITSQHTEGPYFVDERLNRSDIRSDPSDGTLVDGVPLRLVLQVAQVTASACSPLVGAQVDLWQCDALGNYSDEHDMSGLFDTVGNKFLRGYQITDADGAVQFMTIYPGWYPGRTPHIHFKVRTAPDSQSAPGVTSQFYFDD